MRLASVVRQRALEAGFDLVGVAPAEASADHQFLPHWLELGYGGEIRYLEDKRRQDPRRVLPSVKSVVCVAQVYNAPYPHSQDASASRARPRAWISRYAWGKDYHQAMRAKLERLRKGIEELEPAVETRVYVDTGPVLERAFARQAGIGWMGKNTCLINEGKGSWLFLGVILTNLELEPDLPAPDRCGSCTRCLEACPTGALRQPYVMDASRCISYLNVELKGAIPEEFRRAVGNNAFGCDVCQDVCPWNNHPRPALGSSQPADLPPQGAATTILEEFQPAVVAGRGNTPPHSGRVFSLFYPALEDLLSITEEDFRRAFARSPIKRLKYRGWLRNLCVVAGNSRDPQFIPWLGELARHPDPLVQEHARWGLSQLPDGTDAGTNPSATHS